MKVMEYVRNPIMVVRFMRNHELLNWMPDKPYLKLVFQERMGRRLDLENPKTFNEKIQWLKLYDRKPIYTVMADKYKAKEYVASIIGDEHIVPTFGVWDTFEEIDFEKLPNRFVLKCTHDSGGLVVCKDKAKLNREVAKAKIEKSLKTDYYLHCREWPYKDIKRKIIAEKFMEDETTIKNGIRDYKFFCFNGEPKFIYISEGMEDHATAKMIFLDMNWKITEFQRIDYKRFSEIPEKPSKFDEMVCIAKKLSKGMDFLRVDLYQISERVYFSELTFSPCAGYMQFEDENSDLEIGKMLDLTKKGKNK